MPSQAAVLSVSSTDGEILALTSLKGHDVATFLETVDKRCSLEEKQFVSRVLRRRIRARVIECDYTELRWLLLRYCDRFDDECLRGLGRDEVDRITRFADQKDPPTRVYTSMGALGILSVVIYFIPVVLLVFAWKLNASGMTLFALVLLMGAWPILIKLWLGIKDK